MPRFAANLSTMFTELPFPERFAAAAAAGFAAVELQEACDRPAREVAVALRAAGLDLVLANAPGGADGNGLAALPGRESEFEDVMAKALAWAAAAGAPRLHVMAGLQPADRSRGACEATLTANLRRAAPAAAAHGVALLVEAINSRDLPGYVLRRQRQARRVVEAVGRDNVSIQFDFYHCQVMEGDLARRFGALLPLIGHVQISDNPGRHEPGSGEIAWPRLFDAIDRAGYRGWVGAEYHPAGTTWEGLGWFQPYRASQGRQA